MDHAHGETLAVRLAKVEIERLGLLQSRFRLHRSDQRQSFAGDQIVDRHRPRLELGEIKAEPVGERRVDIEDLALLACGEEPGGRMVEIIDGVLQLLEEALLVVALRSDVGNLPDVERVSPAVLERKHARLEAKPVRTGTRRPRACAKRLHQPELLVSCLSLAKTVGQAIDRLGRLAVAR